MNDKETHIIITNSSDSYASYEEILVDTFSLIEQGTSDTHLRRYVKNISFLNRLQALRDFRELKSKDS